MKGVGFLNFSEELGTGFYPERVENTSTESTTFQVSLGRCASI